MNSRKMKRRATTLKLFKRNKFKRFLAELKADPGHAWEGEEA